METTMDKAIFGLIGVVLGVLLTVAKEWWFQSRKNRKDAEYLSIQIVCMLDRYVAGCAEVVGDNGLYHGQPDRDGNSKIQISAPKFEPELAKVEWKSLPANLMYEVLTFPNNIEVANNMVSAAFEHASPPDYDGGFEERQYQYAELGIAADALAAKLRIYANLPARQTDKWDSVKYMKDERQKCYAHRERIAANNSL
jgi:hypothetical protein